MSQSILLSLDFSLENISECEGVTPQLMIAYIQTQNLFVLEAFGCADFIINNPVIGVFHITMLNTDFNEALQKVTRVMINLNIYMQYFNKWAISEGMPSANYHIGMTYGDLIIREKKMIGLLISESSELASFAKSYSVRLVIDDGFFSQNYSQFNSIGKIERINLKLSFKHKRVIRFFNDDDINKLNDRLK